MGSASRDATAPHPQPTPCTGHGAQRSATVPASFNSFFVNDLKLDNNREHAPVPATELVGTSITSGAGKYGAFAGTCPRTPHPLLESRLRGYTRCTSGRDCWHTDLRVVDSITLPDGGVRTLARFLVEDGRPGAHRLR